MKHLFIPNELSVLAKQKGFNDECLQFNQGNNTYTTITHDFPKSYKNYGLITYQQIIDWFRDKHDIEVFAQIHFTGNKTSKYHPFCYQKVQVHFGIDWNDIFEDKPNSYSYHEALNKAIEGAFKLI